MNVAAARAPDAATSPGQRPTVAFFTASAPWGIGNGFELAEMATLREEGFRVLLVPREPRGVLLDARPEDFGNDLLATPLLRPRYLGTLLGALFRPRERRAMLATLRDILLRSGRRNVLKNLAVFPKSVHLAREIQGRGVAHIHAAWCNTPATMAYVVSALTGIPWSMTGHRGDIKVGNMLAAKGRTASFVRASTVKGVHAFERAGVPREKIALVRMGTRTPERPRAPGDAHPPVVLAVANLLPVKALDDLVMACGELVDRVPFECWIVGEGPERGALESLLREHGLAERVKLLGAMGHAQVLDLYQRPEVRLVALTSKLTADGAEEGVPVALIEAMGAGLPVVATDCGSIPELLADGPDLLVPQGDRRRIAAAIARILEEPAHADAAAAWCRARVLEAFDQTVETAKLAALIRANLAPHAVEVEA